jgi:hypothetical protein
VKNGGKMACGCGKGNTTRGRTPVIRPVTSARSVTGGIASVRTPTEVRNQSLTPQPPVNAGGINAEKRKVQALRRDAIKKSLGK